jgi:chemotaxis signal transduction protein
MSAAALGQRLADFRGAFDRPFAEPPRIASPETEDLLAVRIAGDPYALKVRDLTGLGSNRKIVPLPSSRDELLGVAGIRGKLVLVYSLPVLLGYAAGTSLTPWLALCGGSDPVALAFDELESFVRVRRTDLCVAEADERSSLHVREVVRIGAVARPVIDARSTVTAVKAGAGVSGSTKER